MSGVVVVTYTLYEPSDIPVTAYVILLTEEGEDCVLIVLPFIETEYIDPISPLIPRENPLIFK
jgi:hypothetical protein